MVTTVVCLVRTTYRTWTFPDVETNVVSHAGISLLWLEELFTTFLLRLQQSAESKTEESLLILLTFATYSTTLITPSFQTICRLEATGKEYRKNQLWSRQQEAGPGTQSFYCLTSAGISESAWHDRPPPESRVRWHFLLGGAPVSHSGAGNS